MSYMDSYIKQLARKRAARLRKQKQPHRKIAKACERHRADHSNPGGVVSEYFRSKNSKVA